MTTHQNKFHRPATWLLPPALLLAAALAAAADPSPARPVLPVTVRSVFVIPTSPKDGRDPFFPESMRVFQSEASAKNTVELTSLTLRGFSGTPGHRLVIINNHTFAAGDEGDVITASGRVHIHCLEINPNAVVVEASGQRLELTFSSQ